MRPEFTILGIPSDEFPEIPVVQEEQSISLPQHLLKSMIDQTLFAISTNDSKPVHTGSLFQLEDGELRVVSVDGFRLALRREKVSAEGSAQFIIPGKTLSEMNKLLSDEEDEETRLYLSRSMWWYRLANTKSYPVCWKVSFSITKRRFRRAAIVPLR